MPPRPAYSTVDLAWSVFAKNQLPPPSPERLLTRGRVPLDTVGFFRKFYGIPHSVSVKKEYANLGNPGHVTITPPNYIIRINGIYRGWHDAEASIVAHEMVHVLMDQMKIEGRDRWEDEMFTDSFAVFLGTALISNFRISVDFYEGKTLISSMGYMKPDERFYAMARFASECSLKLPSHPSGEWRVADLEGMGQAMRVIGHRLSCAKKPPVKTPSGLVCPRCESLLPAPVSRCLPCLECGASWLKGMFGYRLAAA